MEDRSQPEYCSSLSVQADEPLIGTATTTTRFLLVEDHGAWGPKALEDSELPEAVKRHLDAFGRSRADCKVLLIRSPRSQAEPGVRLLAAQLGEGHSQVHDVHLPSHEDLLQVDLDALFNGHGEYAGQLRRAPVYLVCTHGRRDRCCSRVGIPVYTALQEAARQEDRQMGVWQCSHVGGHRFAANLICLSSGLLYGRVGPQDARAIVDAERRGEMRLENLRGRLCYSPPAQAAEHGLRRAIGRLGLQEVRLDTLQAETQDAWTAVFLVADGIRYRVRVRARQTGARVYESCTQDKTTPVVEYKTEIELD